MNLAALKAERAKLRGEADRLAALTESTPDIEAQVEDVLAKLEQNASAIDRAERLRDVLRTQPAEEAEAQPTRVEVGATRETLKPWGYQAKAAGARPEVVKNIAAGEFLIAVAQAGMIAKQGGGQIDPRLTYEATATGAGERSPSDGGYLVGQDLADDIQLRMTGGEILSRVKRVPISAGSNSVAVNMIDESSRATGSRFGGVQGYWVDEGGQGTATRPKFWRWKLELNKIIAVGYATDELLSDAAAIGSVMPAAFAEELKFLTEDAFFEGSGVGQPLGILGHAATVSVAKETGQAAATFVYENALKMWARMPAKLRKSAVWHINQELEPQLPQMALVIGVGGVPVFLPASGASQEGYSTLFGRPIIPIEYCAAAGTVGDIVLASWDDYGYGDKGGIKQDTSMHVAFLTDEMAFRCTYRVDGKPKWRTVLTPFKGSANATQGPFITLATRA